MRKILFFLQICVVLALPGILPTPTSFTESTVVPLAPSPTPPPRHELLKRNISMNVCGWIDGDINDPLTCADAAATCLWHSRGKVKVVGCMTSPGTVAPPFSTSCVDYSDESKRPTATISNVLICPSTAPLCNTVNFPNSYSMLSCGIATSTVNIVLSGSGLPTPASLPQFLDSKGSVRYEEEATDFSQRGSIIAACVGGGVLLLGLPFGIKMVIRKINWRKAEKAPKVRNLKHPFVREQLPPGPNFLFSQEWHGAPAPAAPSYQKSWYQRGR